ncbi:DsbA family oxidoreductase [Maridesulfovibrio frigidus]|uniref:DsbA family oxidoreductase n=1 Tax=Maridesulfovibrio frigidus TaxID=340956 RepID=UPI0004E28D3F|nr:DsbA family oxidoreductase [Maridesulfovibrio frigidus]
MAEKIKINIVSDVTCPWCIIGYKRLANAISEMGIEDRIVIEWEPFEINPNMIPDGEELHEHMHNKYGTTKSDSIQTFANMTSHGADVGFTFDFFEGMRTVNTRNAHILLEYAKDQGKQVELKLQLFDAFFSNRKDVSNQDVLAQILEEVGLNVEDALQRLSNTDALKKLQTRESHWLSLGVNSVPTMFFNENTALSGARSVDTYKQVLTDLIEQKGVRALF